MAGAEPPYLPEGTDVSAKYRGAFCEAKVKKVVKSVKCKVALKDLSGSVLVTDECIKGQLKLGATVEIKHPETGHIVEGIISKLTDSSMYTVVFDDADERTLRRTQLCLKGEKHFIESETLDNLPLSHPEHFGTPVMQSTKEKKKRRSLRDTEEEESEVSSAESDMPAPKRANYKGKNRDLVGKVMYIEVGDKKKMTAVPVLVTLPDAHSTELRTKDHLLVRSFKDSKYLSVSRRELKEFVREVALKNEDKSMKSAMEKALLYYDSGEPPASWNKEELLGYETEVDDGADDDSSDDEPSEEKDRFVAQLYKFMDDRGTPINKGPTIGSKDLNLYKLFKVVQTIGGYNRVTNTMRWRLVYSKMNLPQSNSASAQIKNAYKKYLHAFEDFYRKLGSTMGTISRPGRSRHNSGRSLFRDTQRKSAEDMIMSHKERKTPVKEVKGKDGDRRGKDTPENSETEQETKKQLDPVKKELSESFKSESDTPKKEEKPSDKKDDTREKRDLREGKDKKSKDEDDKDKRDEKKDPTEDDKGMKATRKRVRATATATITPGRKSPRVDDGKKDEEEETESVKKDEKKDDKKDEKKEDKKEDKKDEKKDDKKDDKKDTRRKMKEKSKEKDDSKSKADDKDEEEEVEDKSEKEFDESDVLPSATKLKVKYGRGRNQKIYEAKIVESSTEDGSLQYLVHYAGWNMRYDEWVKPDRIVKVVDKPDIGKKPTKSKPAGPQSPKGQQTPSAPVLNKKRGRPSSVTPTRPSSVEPKSQKSRSPAPSGPSKSRPTRSNSVEIPVMSLPSKSRRTRRSSGYTESSDVQSHASESEESEMSFEEKSKEDDRPELEEASVKEEAEDEELEVAPSPPDLQELSSEKPPNLGEPAHRPLLSEVKHEILPERMKKAVDTPVSQHREVPLFKEIKKLEVRKGNMVGLASVKKEGSPAPKEIAIPSPSLLAAARKIIEKVVEKPSPNPTKVAVPEKSTGFTPFEIIKMVPEKALKTKVPDVFSPEKEAKIPRLFNAQADFGSDDESCAVPDIVKEADRKVSHPEVVDFEKPPTLVKAVSLTDLPTDKERSDSKPKVKKPKECKRGRPPIITQDQPLVVASSSSAEVIPDVPPVIKEKVGEKRSHEETLAKPTESKVMEPQIKKEKKEEPTEKVSEKKSDGPEIQVKDENEKKKVKKKLKKKHLEEKGEPEHQKVDSEGVKKEKKVKDGSKKDSKSGKSKEGKLSKKEKKALKKKNKHKENEGEKVKDSSSSSDLSNDSIRKLVAETLNVKEKSHSASPERVVQSSSSLTVQSSSSTLSSASSNTSTSTTSSSTSANHDTKDSSAVPSTEHHPSPAIPPHPPAQLHTPPHDEPQPSVSSILMDNTPPTTPEHETRDVRETPPDNLQLSIDRAVSRTMAAANLETVPATECLPAGGESPSGGEGSTTSNESGSSGNVPSSESSNDMLSTTKRKRDAEDGTPSKKKKRTSKRQEKKQSAKAAGSDSEEALPTEQREISEMMSPVMASPTRGPTRIEPRSPRPSKYNFNLEEGKYLEGEKRITFLVEKISEIRKIYMSLKAEMACIDRRRKRHKRKERESESL